MPSWNNDDHAIDIEGVRAAAARIGPHVHRTLVLTSETLNSSVGAELFCKAEMFQKTGSFKVRGATNIVLKAVESQDPALKKGVVTASSGNFGLAMAKICKERGIPCVIVAQKGLPGITFS